MTEAITNAIAITDSFIWNTLVYVLVILGLVFTVASKFLQFRLFKRMFSALSTKRGEGSSLSSYQALIFSVGGRVGSGNIAGVAVAITLGGPGAVFWMWLVGLMGMATSCFECSIAQLFKHKEGDHYRGGPAHYIVRGLGPHWKWLAIVYSLLLFIAFGVAFNGLQSFSIASSFKESFGINPNISGLFMAGLIGILIFGGIQRLAKVAEFTVPFMAIGYLGCTLYVLVIHFSDIGVVLAMIVKNALGIEQVVGGTIGGALMLGVQRGLFSNEAGLGSAPNVAAAAEVSHPVQQGLAQALSVFIDTIILCSCTAVIILLSQAYQPGVDTGNGIVLTQQALSTHIGSAAGAFVSIALFFFGFTSIMYNYYLGENGIDFITGPKKIVFTLIRIGTIGIIYWGAVVDLSTVFSFANLAMGLLAIANLAALILLLPTGLKLIKDYEQQLKEGQDQPVFDTTKFKDLDIEHEVWK